jgi:prepilin-type N-terminal cleavage/methylation domain-containing protein
MSHSTHDSLHCRDGFSLVEILVTVTIVAILAALAVPAYAKLRERIYDATALSDVINAGKAIVADDHVDSFATMITGPRPVRELPGVVVSAGTQLLVFRIRTGPNSAYYMVGGSHRNGSGAWYYFTNGHLYALGAQI